LGVAYKENLQIVESNNCAVVLRDGTKMIGHMRRFDRYTDHPAFSWILIPRDGAKVKPQIYNSNGNYSIHAHVVSQRDIVDFVIGTPPEA